MVWFGLVWFGLVWFGLVWFGLVWLGWVGLGWVGLGWVGLGWVGLGWVGLGWVGLGWVGLGWVGLGWVGLGWVGLGWVGLGLVVCLCVCVFVCLCVCVFVCLCVCVFVCLCGCVVVWLCGCVVVWLCGCVVVWLFGCLVVWLFGCLVVWLFGCCCCVSCGEYWCVWAGGSSHSASTSASSAVSEASSASSSSPRMWHNVILRLFAHLHFLSCVVLSSSLLLFSVCLSVLHTGAWDLTFSSARVLVLAHHRLARLATPSTQRDHTLCVIRAFVPTLAVQPPRVCHRRETGQSPRARTCSRTWVFHRRFRFFCFKTVHVTKRRAKKLAVHLPPRDVCSRYVFQREIDAPLGARRFSSSNDTEVVALRGLRMNSK